MADTVLPQNRLVESYVAHARMTKRTSVITLMAFTFFGLFVATSSAQPANAAPALNAYVSQPFVQGPSSVGSEIETFDASCPSTWWHGLSNEGTLSGSCTSLNGNIWGGASTTSGFPTLTEPSAQTKYGMISRGQNLTVTLDHPASYLGFDWQAGDACNTLTIANSGTVIATFTTEDLMSMIYSGSVGEWSSNEYLFNPARSQWVGQPFAFIHLVGVNGLTFDSITFSQPCSGGFEFDNFTIIDEPVTLDPETVVAISDTTPPDEDRDGTNDLIEDSDNDGIVNPFEDADGDNVAEAFEDSDNDGVTDYVESLTSLPNTGAPRSVDSAVGVILVLSGMVLVILRRRAVTRKPGAAASR